MTFVSKSRLAYYDKSSNFVKTNKGYAIAHSPLQKVRLTRSKKRKNKRIIVETAVQERLFFSYSVDKHAELNEYIETLLYLNPKYKNYLLSYHGNQTKTIYENASDIVYIEQDSDVLDSVDGVWLIRRKR